MSNQSRLKILFLPAWYPSEDNPVRGTFVKEHAKAASLYNDIIVLYTYHDPSPRIGRFYRISDSIEDGIRTIRVRYGGLFLIVWKKLMDNKKRQGASSGLDEKPVPILKRLLKIAQIIISEFLYWWCVFSTFRKLLKEGWRPDIIHVHVFKAGVPAIILGKIYRIPVIITEHSTAFPRRLLTKLDIIKAKFVMNRAKLVLPVSYDLKRHIQSYGIINKFEVVPNVVDTTLFQSDLNVPDEKKVKNILLVALLDPKKGIPYLLQALNKLKEKRQDFVLDIVGDGPYRQEYEKLAEELKVQDLVKFHGLKSKKEVAEFMRQCDFFVLPSLWENLPCVLIEVLSCGKPVIASKVGGIPEIVTKEIGFLIPPKNIDILAETIDYLLDHYQNYSPKKISQYVKEKFSCERVGKKLDNVYREIVYKKPNE